MPEQLRAATVHRNQQTARQLEAMRQEVLDLHEARRSDELVVVAFQIRMRQLAEAIQISRSEVQDMSNQHNAFLRQQFAIFRSLDVAAYDNQTPADVYRELKAAHMKAGLEHLRWMLNELTLANVTGSCRKRCKDVRSRTVTISISALSC